MNRLPDWAIAVIVIVAILVVISSNQQTPTPTPIVSSPAISQQSCSYTQDVKTFHDRVTSRSGLTSEQEPIPFVIERGKNLYIQIKQDSSCVAETEQLATTLRAVWQQFINRKWISVYRMCIGNCLLSSNSSLCSSDCDRQRSEGIERESKAINDFF